MSLLDETGFAANGERCGGGLMGISEKEKESFAAAALSYPSNRSGLRAPPEKLTAIRFPSDSSEYWLRAAKALRENSETPRRTGLRVQAK
jgi:hypothetical protein